MTWVNELGGSTLYTSIDEITPDDNDYVYFSGYPIVGDNFTVTLENPSGTVPSGSHVLRWRASTISGGLTIVMKCELLQGSGVITYDEQTLSGFYTTYEKTLNQSEIDSITNYDDLKLRFTVTGIS